MHQPNRQKKWPKLAAILLLILGVLLLSIEPLKNAIVKQQSANVPAISTADIERNEEAKEVTYDFEQVEAVTLQSVLASRFSDTQLPVIGAIAVPDVQLQLPILNGLSNENLVTGAGTMKPDQEMGKGNYALASHTMSDPSLLFAPLHQAELGMRIYLTDMDSYYVYEVVRHEMIDPTEVSVIEDTGETLLTLITCNITADRRLVTQAKLIDTLPVTESPEIASYF